MVEQISTKHRNEIFDIMKGLGIVAMILAHTFGPNNLLWNFICTFHMPLFFVVSGYFYKNKSIQELSYKSFSTLIIPYLTACVIIVFLTQVRQQHSIGIDINNILYGLGPGWFLLAMFFAKIEFHYVLKLFPTWHLIISLVISASICLYVSYTNSRSILSFYPSIASLVFISVGYYVRQNNLLVPNNKYRLLYIFILLFWFVTLIYGKVEMYRCYFHLNVIDFVGSVCAVFMIYKLSQRINKRKLLFMKTLLLFVGRYSLIFLFFHTIGYCVYIWYLFEPFILNKTILCCFIFFARFFSLCCCVIISLRFRKLRSFFNIK